MRSHPSGQDGAAPAEGLRGRPQIPQRATERRGLAMQGQRTLRGWMYVLVTLACYLAFCLVGLLMVLPVDYGGGEASIGLTGQILGACILVVFAGPLIRTPFLRVVLSDEGIVVHNPVRTRRYTWGQIARCEVGEIGGNLVPLVAPILTLADSDESFGIRFLESFWLFRKPEQTRAGRLAATIEARRLSAIG